MDFGLTPEAQTTFLVIAYLLGVALRVAWPYWLRKLEEDIDFDINYIVGQVFAAVIGLFGIMAAPDFLQTLGAVGYFGAFVAGYGAASVGRDGQKTIERRQL